MELFALKNQKEYLQMYNCNQGRNLDKLRREWGLQREFLDQLDGEPVNIIMINGYQMKCFVNNIDGEVLIVTRPGTTTKKDVQCMIYKHAISTIEPTK